MSLFSRIANIFRADRLNGEIAEELESHIQDAIAAGRDPDEARRALGPLLRQREVSHRIRVVSWLESLAADMRFGWRQLLRNKLTSITAVLSLALGIGSCVAAFRLIDALLWRPLPIADADRLYALSCRFIDFNGKQNEYTSWSTPLFTLMRDAVKNQAELIAASYTDRTDISYASNAEMEKAYIQYVSGSTFSSFGLLPTLGRLLTADDDRIPGAAPYAVLSWDYWNHRFGRDPRVIGRALHIADRTYEIVGVGPRSFTGTERGTVTDIFLPLMMGPYIDQKGVTWHRIFVVVRPGIPIEPLRLKITAVNHAFEAERSKDFSGMTPQSLERFLNQQVFIKPASSGASDLQEEYRRALDILGVLVVIVLLIACVNVANLMTAQAASREKEMALRVSIGAGRQRLVQLILAQSAILAVFASALGVLFAVWSAPLVLGLIGSSHSPVSLDLPADWRVALFVVSLMAAVMLLLGLLPALRASAVRPVMALKGGSDPHTPRRLMRGAIALQVAFCFLVLFMSALFVASFERLSRRPMGFSTDRLLLLETVAQKGQPHAAWTQTAEALQAVPGVESVTISAWPLLQGNAWYNSISVNGAPPGRIPGFFLRASPGWLGMMKIPFVEGRDFRPSDTSPGQAIVNETFVRTFFPSQDAVGRSFVISGQNKSHYEIVAVVRDTPYRSLREPILPVAYVPFPQKDDAGAFRPERRDTFLVRTIAANPLALGNTLRQAVADRHVGLRVSNIQTQDELVRDQTVRERLLAMLAAFFACVALLLAAIGLYGVLNYSVVQRRREIGIRLAVGSPRARIARLIAFEIAAAVAVGASAGIVLGLGSARYVESLFYQVKSTDADMLALPTLAILLTALIATLPAILRALRTNPTEILRAE